MRNIYLQQKIGLKIRLLLSAAKMDEQMLRDHLLPTFPPQPISIELSLFRKFFIFISCSCFNWDEHIQLKVTPLRCTTTDFAGTSKSVWYVKKHSKSTFSLGNKNIKYPRHINLQNLMCIRLLQILVDWTKSV